MCDAAQEFSYVLRADTTITGAEMIGDDSVKIVLTRGSLQSDVTLQWADVKLKGYKVSGDKKKITFMLEGNKSDVSPVKVFCTGFGSGVVFTIVSALLIML